MITGLKGRTHLGSSGVCRNVENEGIGRARNGQQHRGEEASIPVATQLKQTQVMHSSILICTN